VKQYGQKQTYDRDVRDDQTVQAIDNLEIFLRRGAGRNYMRPADSFETESDTVKAKIIE